MARTKIYLYAAVAIFLIVFLFFFLAPAVRNSLAEQSYMETPTIPPAKAVWTSFASIRIKATEDEVFDVITKFDDYSSWSSSISDYKFDLPGIPQTGSHGTFKVSLFPFASCMLIRFKIYIEFCLSNDRNVFLSYLE